MKPARTLAARERRSVGTALALCAGVGWLAGALVLLEWLAPRAAWPRGLACLALLIFAPLYTSLVAQRAQRHRRGAWILIPFLALLELLPAAFVPAPWAAGFPACLAILLQGHLLMGSARDSRAIGCALLGPLHVSIALQASASPLLLALLPVAVCVAVPALVLVHRRHAVRRLQRGLVASSREAGWRLSLSLPLALATCGVGLALFLLLATPPWERLGGASSRSNRAGAASPEARREERRRAGTGAAGDGASFSTDLRFGAGGVFPLGKAVVMRVRPSAGRVPGDKLLMRTHVLDVFDAQGARLSDPRVPALLRDEDDGRVDGWTIVGEQPAAAEQLLLQVQALARTLELSGEAWTVLAAPHPVAAVSLPEVRYDPDRVFVATGPVPDELSYRVVCELFDGSPANLRGRRARHPAPRFVALPPGPAAGAIAARARRLARGAGADFERVERVMAFLTSEFDYALENLGLAGPEAIARFLEVRRGYCTCFASAATLLLRSLDVSARLALGFSAHEWSEEEAAYLVRERDLHAWVEVFWEGVGWISYDPTPAAEREVAFAVVDGEIDPPARSWRERLREGVAIWADSGASEDLGRVLALVVEAPLALARERPLAGLAGALLLALALWRRARSGRTGAGRAAPPAALEAGPAALAGPLYERLTRALARHGWRRARAQTPRELARAVHSAEGARCAALPGIVEAFYRARFGERPLSADEERAVEAFVELLAQVEPPAPEPRWAELRA